jgi:hypothetical protein
MVILPMLYPLFFKQPDPITAFRWHYRANPPSDVIPLSIFTSTVIVVASTPNTALQNFN